MWTELTLSLVLLSSLSSYVVAAQSPAPEPVQQLSLPAEAQAQHVNSERKWDLDFYLELRSFDSKDERPILRNRQSIHEAELGFGYQLDPDLRLRLSGVSEEFSAKSEFYLKEAFVSYTPAPRWFELRLGQKLMSIGFLNELENSFSSNPGFYSKLWTAKKGIDLGAELEFYPFQEKFIYLKGAIYSGQILRPGDGRMDPPEAQPREFSLRSRSKYHEAFLSRFEQNLAFVDPLEANGLGVNAASRDLLPGNFELKFFSELWDITEVQSQGPNESTLGYFVFPSVRWKRISLGYRYGETKTTVGQNENRVELPSIQSRLVRAEVEVTPHFSLMAEQLHESSDRVLKNELTVRAIVDWQLD